ncbi:MAG: RNA-binding S4 domain-containing protein [Gammaproteobacteria bacterium]|jgi:ribosome-associated heat shock protein Hsp15
MIKEQKKQLLSMRLDKWLWCSRFFKTRKLALEAIKSGKIKQNDSRVKPSRSVYPGEIYAIKQGPYIQIITILSLTTHRRAANEASLLYKEDDESIKQRQLLSSQLKINNAMVPRSIGRPDKHDRRKIIKFMRSEDE